MLFRKQKDSQQESDVNTTNGTSPNCDTNNPPLKKKTVGPGAIVMPFWKQLIYFGIDFIGVTIISFLMSIIGTFFGMDEKTVYSFTVFSTYFVILCIAVFFTILNWNYFKEKLKKVYPYVIGIIGGILIIALQMAYSITISSLGIEMSTNENEYLVEDMIFNYPLLSVLIFAIAAPIVEELAFRLGFFTFLCRVNRIFAYIVSILLFSMMHMSFDGLLAGNLAAFYNELLNLPTYILGGIVLTLVYDFHGLSSSIVAHVTLNLFVVGFNVLVGA